MTKLVDVLPIAIASMSLGRAAHHDLETKLAAASAAGFRGVELFYEDIKLPARAMTEGKFETNLHISAQHFRDLCDKYNLKIIVFQPFKNYDGLLSPQRHAEKIEKLKNWIKIAKILRTDIIQIPSMFHRDPTVATGDDEKIVGDLREVADLGKEEGIRFAYEIMAWGAYNDTWQDAWRIAKKVDRDNFGMCLDTYQILANTWGDCTAEQGKRLDADENMRRDLKELVETVPLEKIYYVQLSDAMKLSTPIGEGHEWWDSKMKPNMIWSRNARLFPCEEELGGYLPVLEMFSAWVFELGYRGWVSMELFNRSMSDTDSSVPEVHAKRGMASWKKCVAALKLDEKDA
ncbi:sugar phosphate isomerase [Pyronema omphalodes]|nr:sugar phosphate isomerase [Pyronema omphalodes]